MPAALARELNARGHAAYTARDLGLAAAADPVQLRSAAQDGRILVTHNKGDFLLLHRAWRDWMPGSPHAGILIMKQQQLLVPEMARAIHSFVMGGRDLTNQAYAWMASGRWVRH